MTDFHSVEMRKAAKDHRCEHCRKAISKGETHRRVAQVWEGDFHSYREHVECFNAWNELNFTIRGLYPSEGAVFLGDDDHEDGEREWMCEAYPIVAERMGWLSHKPSASPSQETVQP